MKDVYDKLKVISDIVKDNKWLVLIAFTGLSSMATNAGQFISSLSYEEDKAKAIHEVATGFQSAMIEIEPKVVKSTRSPCGSYLDKHLKMEH